VPEHAKDVAAEPEPAATGRAATAEAPHSAAALVLRLQRTAGNAATARLLQRFVNPAARKDTLKDGTVVDDTAMVQERFTGPLYHKGAGDAADVDPNDVKQGYLGDCYFLSPIQAVARINPARIRQLIRGPLAEKVDGRNVYEVDLYEGHAVGSPTKHTVRVDDRFVSYGGGSARYAQPGDMSAAGPEIWVMVLEKAWAAIEGGYSKIHGGHAMKLGLTAITGYDTDYTTISRHSSDAILEELVECQDAGKPVVIETKEKFTNEELDLAFTTGRKVIANHAYNVAHVDKQNKTVDLVNPHGTDDLPGLPIFRLKDWFHIYVMSEESVK
jgi:Calpain family cysteine protease